MKKLLLLFIALFCMCVSMNAQSQLIDVYKSVNVDFDNNPTNSVTFAITITNVSENDMLTITRETVLPALNVNVVENNVYNPNEWYARYDTLMYVNDNVRFADTFMYDRGNYDRTVHYTFILNGNTIATYDVNFDHDTDIVTSLSEITTSNITNDKIYDVYGHEVTNIQPNVVYIKNGKKWMMKQ